MKSIFKILALSLVALFAAVSCSSGDDGGDGFRLHRLESVVFETPFADMPARLASFREEFPSPLLIITPSDDLFMSQLESFASDSTMRAIYDITMSRYGDLRWLEKELAEALAKARKLDSQIDIDRIATFVSGYFDYDSRILADRYSRSLVVSLDQYALGDMERFGFFDSPLFIVERSDSAFLASDIMAEVARQYIAAPDEGSAAMLDFMVAEGKVLYFLDKVMPGKADNVKIRYSDEQMDWARRNESNIWTYFIQNNLLYEKDFNRYHNFVDEAPKTNAFRDSAPRTTDFIGWQIVRSYMDNNSVSLAELFANNDAQSILQLSKYKP